MKRFLSLLFVAVSLIGLVSCNNVGGGISSDASENSSDTYSSRISNTESTSHFEDTSSISETSSYTESVDKQTETSNSLSTSSGKRIEDYSQEELNEMYDQFSSVEKFITWINNTDLSYKFRRYKETLEAIRKEGYILEPYYKNKRFPLSKKRGYLVAPQGEADYSGHGYAYVYQHNQKDFFTVYIYYLEKEEAEDAKNNLHNYLSGVGRFGPSKYTWEEIVENGSNKGFEKSFNEVIGKEIISYRYSLASNAYVFLYEEQYVIRILNTVDSSLTFDEFIKDLSFKKVSISQ